MTRNYQIFVRNLLTNSETTKRIILTEMLRPIEIEGNIWQVDEAADGSFQIVGHPDVMVTRLSNHVIEVFRGGKSLGCFKDENASFIPSSAYRTE